MDDRRKVLELFSKQLQSGNPLMEDFIDPSQDMVDKAFDARDLAQESLANEVLKKTDVAIPGKGSTKSQVEDFYNRVLKERYPEMEPNVQVADLAKERASGMYHNGKIGLDIGRVRDEDIRKSVSTMLHEGGHQYDEHILDKFGKPVKFEENKIMKGIPSGRALNDIDPAQAYEILGKKHHAQIPNLREGTFGLGALKSMLKSGTFKALPVIGTAATAAAALSSPDASAAIADFAIPGGLEQLGPSNDDAIIENPQASPDLRRQALERMKNGR